MKRLLLGLAAAATAVCAAPEPAYRELPPEPPPAAARPGTGTPSPDDLAARQAVQGLTAFCQSLTAEQHAAAVEWSNENRGRENNERLGELTWKIGASRHFRHTRHPGPAASGRQVGALLVARGGGENRRPEVAAAWRLRLGQRRGEQERGIQSIL